MNAKLNRVVLVDPSVIGESHILVNTGFLSLLSEMTVDIIVITENSHSNALQKYVDLSRSCAKISYIVYDDRSDLQDILRKIVSSQEIDVLFFLNLEYRIFLYINLSLRKYHVGLKCWVLHSHLASLGKSGLFIKIISRIKFLMLFNFFSDNRFVVLGDRIEVNTRRALSWLLPRGRTGSVFHPVGVRSLEAKFIDPNGSRQRTLTVMFLHGWHRLSNDRLLTLAKLTETSRRTGQFNFTEIQTTFNSGPFGRYFSKKYSERLRDISAADFIVQLPTDPYLFQASGALMDMVVSRTPAIGIATDFGRDLESKIGRYGYFFDTDAELIDFMENFGDNYSLVDHKLFISNLKIAGESLNQRARNSLSLLIRTSR